MYSKNDYRSSSYLREIKFKNTKGYTAEQGMNRTETRVKISTSASNFHKSLRENTSKFGESKVNAKALMMIISVIITDMGSCFICT